jgi:hypothetical protein
MANWPTLWVPGGSTSRGIDREFRGKHKISIELNSTFSVSDCLRLQSKCLDCLVAHLFSDPLVQTYVAFRVRDAQDGRDG